MLLRLTKKFCPLVSLALVFGCGKKINETQGASELTADHTTLSNILTLQIKEEVSITSEFKLPKNGWFMLPNKLLAIQGSALGKRVVIRYNVQEDGTYEFHCSYKSVSSETEMDFEKCHYSMDDHGTEVEMVTDAEQLATKFALDAKTHIRMELQNPNPSNLIINSIYQVDWK